MSRSRGGIPLVAKRVFYIELMKTGLSNSEACRRVGVNRKTGFRWQHGRRSTFKDRSYVYAPINDEIAPKKPESGRYLSQEERIVIADGSRAGLSGRKIAALLLVGCVNDRQPCQTSNEESTTTPNSPTATTPG